MAKKLYDFEEEQEQQLDRQAQSRALRWPPLRHIPTLKGTWRVLVLSGALLLITGVILLLCGASAEWSAFFCRISDLLRRAISLLGSFSRMPLAELLLPAAVLTVLITFLKAARRGLRTLLRWGANLLLAGSCVLLAFVLLYGVCYTAPDLTEQLGLEVRAYSVNELAYAMNKTVHMMNEYAADQLRDESGAAADPDFEDQAQKIMASYEKLSGTVPRFGQTAGVRPKQTRFIGELMSYLDLAGFFFPWTAECIVSHNVYPTDVAFDAAHEAAHGMGIGPEDQCNFAAFLCLMEQEDRAMRYSAAMHGFIYLNNALYAQDRDLWAEVYAGLEALPRADLAARNAHLAQYDGPANDLGNAVNDTFIKATGQPEGVRSYGKVADLLIAYFLQQ